MAKNWKCFTYSKHFTSDSKFPHDKYTQLNFGLFCCTSYYGGHDLNYSVLWDQMLKDMVK